MPRKTTGRKPTAAGSRGKSSSARSTAQSTKRATSKRRTTEGKSKPKAKAKAGGSRAAAGKSARGGDFGIPASNRRAARGAAEKTKKRPAGDRNPDDRQPRAGVESREAGVGARAAGRGSASGGDVDTDIIGLPDARGLAQSAPDNPEDIGPAESTGGSEEFASGPPAQGHNQPARGRDEIRGTTHDRGGGDATTTDTSAPGTVGHIQATDAGAGHADISQHQSRESHG